LLWICQDITTKTAVQVAKRSHAKLFVVHAIEPLHAYGVAEAYPMIEEVEGQIKNEVRECLHKLGEKYGISPSEQLIETGSPVSVILENAKKLNVDLIIVGSHGRHGIRLLLGSTSNAVIHLAQCDVLAVRVKE
jgi:universal stress protein A